MKKGIFIVVVVLLLIAFGVSAFMVGSYLLEGKEQKDRYEELAQIAANGRETQNVSESIESATIIFATLPILVVYPFVQRYFVSGVTIGAVKG